MDCLTYVNKGNIPNFGPLGPLLNVEKFVVGGCGWWVVVVETNFSVKLEPQAEQKLLNLIISDKIKNCCS